LVRYDHARETLERLRQHGGTDSCHGIKMEYIDPTSGGPAIPTISTFLQLLPRGFGTEAYAATSSSIVCVVAGRGRATIGRDAGARTIAFAPRDLFVVPSWQPLQVTADEESVLFSASDEAVQRKFGVWRERRGS
jgi:gentisate 1,2-dioxygenase